MVMKEEKGNKISLFSFPNDKNIGEMSETCEVANRKGCTIAHPFSICCFHFYKDDFANYVKYSTGKTLHLVLKRTLF